MIYQDVGALIAKQQTAVATPTATVLDAALQMAERRVGAVAVVEKGELVGIFTERDLLNRVVAASRDPRSVTLAEVMSANPLTIRNDQPLVDALDIMFSRRFRHLPVVNASGDLGGVMSCRDIPAAYQLMRERWVAARGDDRAAAA
jgi:CBS domain-containing protein